MAGETVITLVGNLVDDLAQDAAVPAAGLADDVDGSERRQRTR